MECREITIDFVQGELRLVADVVAERRESGGFSPQVVREKERRIQLDGDDLTAEALTAFLTRHARGRNRIGLWCYENDFLTLLGLLEIGSICPDRVKWPLRKGSDA